MSRLRRMRCGKPSEDFSHDCPSYRGVHSRARSHDDTRASPLRFMLV